MDVLHEVVTLRNSLRPVNRLPPEVIALCATFVSNSDPRPIVSLTHVCRYWRKAITSSPRNWASISSDWKRLVPSCLERAGEVPLTVNIRVSDIKGDEIFLEAILPHTSRIAHLSLAGYRSIAAVAKIIPIFFISTMHNLISLELQQSSKPLEIFPFEAPPMSPISWELSRLTSLRLTRTPLYPALTNITSLVELDFAGYTTPFNFRKFTSFLGSNPDLKIITLDIQFVDCMPWVWSMRTVSLPRLRYLSFTCADPMDARGLFSSLFLPRGVSLEVIGSQANQCFELYSFLPSPPTPIQEILAPITTIKYQNYPRAVEFHGNDSYLSFRCSQFPFGTYSEFSLFPITTVREFHVKIDPYSDLSWPLSQLPALETLVLVGVPAFPIQAFAFLTEQPVLCPSLKTIAFFDCVLNSRATRELEEGVARRKNSTAAWLHRIAIVRRSGALPDHKFIHRLRSYVPYVDARIDDKLPDLT